MRAATVNTGLGPAVAGTTQPSAAATYPGGTTLTGNAGGYYTRKAGGRDYAADHMYYGKFVGYGATCPFGPHKVRALHSAGDAYESHVRYPGKAPWPSCHADPHRFATVEVNGNYHADHSKAREYGLVAHVFGFQVGGRTGYSKHIYIRLTNHGTRRTYACGTRDMPYAPVIYNKKR